MSTFFALLLVAVSSLSPEVRPIDATVRYYGREQGLSNLYVRDIACDGDGEIWVATRDGLNRFDGYSFTTYRTDPDNPWSISCNVIECLEPTSDGRLWIGTDTSLSCYDPYARRFYNYRLPSGHVLDIVQIDESVLFIKNGNKGLFFDIGKHQFLDDYGPVRTGDYKKISILKSDGKIYCSTEDHVGLLADGNIEFIIPVPGLVRKIIPVDRQLWLCKNDSSLHVYDISSGRLSKYDAAGLFGKTRDVCKFDGTLYFATGKGLVAYGPDRSFTTLEVFPTDNAGYHLPVNMLMKDMQGGLWVTSFHDGLSRIETPSSSGLFSPTPVFTGISLNGEDMLPTLSGSVLGKDIRYLDAVRLRGKVSELEIAFSVINLSSHGNNTFRYRLEGYEESWHEQDNRTPAVYSNLRRGRYTFVLYSANAEGVWTEEPARLSVTVGSSKAFILIVSLLAGAAVLLGLTLPRRKKKTLKFASSFNGIEYIFEGINASTCSQESEELLKKIIAAVEKNISDNNYSTSHLARDLGMSRSKMYSRVSEILAIGVGKLISTIKMDIARHLISSGECSIEEAADRTGFGSTSYFNSCFRKHFGKSPRQFLPLIAAALLLSCPGMMAKAPIGGFFREISLPEVLEQRVVHSLCQDSYGFMWMTDGETVLRYDGRTFLPISLEGYSSTDEGIREIVCDHSDRLWALTSEGAWQYDPARMVFRDVLKKHRASVTGLVDVGGGRVLVTSSIGTRVYSIPQEGASLKLFPRNDLRFKSVGTLGTHVFLLENNGGLYRWNIETYLLDYLADAGGDASKISPVLDNLIWIFSSDGGKNLFRIEKGGLVPVRDSTDPMFFLRDGIDDPLKYIDREGGLWCVSAEGKLYHSSRSQSLFSFFPGKDGKNIFSQIVVSCVAAGPGDLVWIGRPGDGTIICYDQSSRTIRRYKGTGAYETKSIVPMGDKILVGFYSGGLQVIDCKKGSVYPVRGISCVRCILPWDEGRYFVTSNSNIYCFDSGTETLSIINPEGWRSSYIKKMHLSSSGDLWVASERGVQVFRMSDGLWKAVEDTDFSIVRRATDIAESSDGTIWIASEYGLWSYDPESATFGEYKEKSGLLTGKVLYSIESSGTGTLWMAGGDGIISLDPSSGYAKQYGGIEGITCSQYNSGASVICPDKKILFAGVGGITVLSPSDIYKVSSACRPVISDVEYGGKKIRMENETEVTLTRSNGASLRISIIFPDFTGSTQYAIAYRFDDGQESFLTSLPADICIDRLKYGHHLLSYYPLNTAGDWKGEARYLDVNVRRSRFELCSLLIPILAAAFSVCIILCRKKKRRNGLSDFLNSVSRVVEENIADSSFSVSDLAARMNLTKKALYDNMKKYGDTTPSNYIKDVRIRKSKELLSSTELTVSEIGVRTGFSSPSYFVLVFRKSTGMTPLSYRQQTRK